MHTSRDKNCKLCSLLQNIMILISDLFKECTTSKREFNTQLVQVDGEAADKLHLSPVQVVPGADKHVFVIAGCRH